MTGAPAGGSAQAEYDKRAARHAEDLRRRRPRILGFGLVVAIIGAIVLVRVSPLYGAVVLLFDAVLVMSAFVAPNSITAWQTVLEHLDRAPEDRPRLARLLRTPSVLERPKDFRR